MAAMSAVTATPFPNQPPAYGDRNLYADDVALQEAVVRDGGDFAGDVLAAWGATLGAMETLALGDAANRHPPELATHDARGERSDTVTFHPAWHELLRLATAAGEHCAPWSEPRTGAQVARAATVVLHAQVESGTQCPLTMTYASVPVLRRAAAGLPLLHDWLPKILARDHDPRALPVGAKRAALIGMGMTERQGGSDVRSNLTRAEPVADGSARLTGHKWFFSAPQCDAHLVLAQDDVGLTCFFLPRFLPDGAKNAVRIDRLKDKLGNRSNASAEVEFDGAHAWPIGEPGRGVATILEMVQLTRQDCVLSTAGMMRSAVARAVHHARHRVAFGRTLAQQPLMTGVLADMAVESEAATALALRLARAGDAPEGHPDRALARLLTPAAKYWVCKRGSALAAEAMEVLGGNGYVEDSTLPRLYREMPVNSIWEGSGNVMCLDVVRAARREPEAAAALDALLAEARGANRVYDAFVATLAGPCLAEQCDEASARQLAQAIATAAQASLLLRHAPAAVADAFCATRLAPHPFGGGAFGGLPRGTDTASIVARALPD
jgi:putative acyl-CoA dehydrogenase